MADPAWMVGPTDTARGPAPPREKAGRVARLHRCVRAPGCDEPFPARRPRTSMPVLLNECRKCHFDLASRSPCDNGPSRPGSLPGAPRIPRPWVMLAGKRQLGHRVSSELRANVLSGRPVRRFRAYRRNPRRSYFRRLGFFSANHRVVCQALEHHPPYVRALH